MDACRRAHDLPLTGEIRQEMVQRLPPFHSWSISSLVSSVYRQRHGAKEDAEPNQRHAFQALRESNLGRCLVNVMPRLYHTERNLGP